MCTPLASHNNRILSKLFWTSNMIEPFRSINDQPGARYTPDMVALFAKDGVRYQRRLNSRTRRHMFTTYSSTSIDLLALRQLIVRQACRPRVSFEGLCIYAKKNSITLHKSGLSSQTSLQRCSGWQGVVQRYQWDCPRRPVCECGTTHRRTVRDIPRTLWFC